MTPFAILIVTAIAQLTFLLALLLFLVDRRRRTRALHALVETRRQESQQFLRAWVAGGAPIDDFIASLARMPGDAALEFASEISASILDAPARETLADALRREPWMLRVLGQADARQWWMRREAARALAITGKREDAPALRRLLEDSNMAVAIIAIGAISRVADEAMVGWALDRYPEAPTVARRLIVRALTPLGPLVEARLLQLMKEDAPPASLARWIAMSAEMHLTAALDRVASLDSHPDSGVRRAVARALSRRPHPDSAEALRALITDASPDVRAAAAWAMGQISSLAGLPYLRRSVHDSAWQVRYQSALALATLGEKGRAVLVELRGDPDRYVADMAVVISGLSDGALLELVAE